MKSKASVFNYLTLDDYENISDSRLRQIVKSVIKHFEVEKTFLDDESVPRWIRREYYELRLANTDFVLKKFIKILQSCTTESLEEYFDKIYTYFVDECKLSTSSTDRLLLLIEGKFDTEPICRFDKSAGQWQHNIPNRYMDYQEELNVELNTNYTLEDAIWQIRNLLSKMFKPEREVFRLGNFMRLKKGYVKRMSIHHLLSTNLSPSCLQAKIFDKDFWKWSTQTSDVHTLIHKSKKLFGKSIMPAIQETEKRLRSMGLAYQDLEPESMELSYDSISKTFKVKFLPN